jgi:dye decolorizing peroxidase/deferrochelatase/peroxidase EfeB
VPTEPDLLPTLPDLVDRPGNRRHDRADRIDMTASHSNHPPALRPVTSRRAVLGVSAAALAGAAGMVATVGRGGDPAPAQPPATVPFHGRHQAGIATPKQRYVVFVGFDLVTRDVAALRNLMRDWTAVAARVTQGHRPPPRSNAAAGAAVDSGDGDGLAPARLTVTFGFGPGVFDARFGLAAQRPPALRDLPAFAGDQLDPAYSGGDLVAQVCADDPQLASYAARQLRSRVMGIATLRWVQQGFQGYPADGGTPRNLFGQKDGTANPAPGTPEFAETVWVPDDAAPAWMAGGTFLVLRRIRMSLAMWDLTPAAQQDAILGRHRDTGAPLSGGSEFTPLDLDRTGPGGAPVIPADAHVRLARPFRMFRRGFNYDDGPQAGEPHTHPAGTEPHDHATHRHNYDAGLLLAVYVRDPGTQFVPAQEALARADRLAAFTTHVGSGVWAVPPGAEPDGYVGRTLLG